MPARAATSRAPARNTKHGGCASVRVRSTDECDDPICDFEDAVAAESEGNAEDDDNSVVEMLSIFEEFQKRKATKTSSRSTEFQRKKNALFDQARMDAEDVVREGVVYVDQARARVAELKAHETSFEKSQRNLSFLAQRQNEAAGVAFDTYTSLLEELSRRRAGQVNEASATLESHVTERRILRRRLLKTAKVLMDENFEKQKLATDATALIKHYKALLLL